jgi:hypothetical protein
LRQEFGEEVSLEVAAEHFTEDFSPNDQE